MTYNLSDKDKKLVDTALSILAQIHDQYDLKDNKDVLRLKRKIKDCSNVQLQTYVGKRTFADEA